MELHLATLSEFTLAGALQAQSSSYQWLASTRAIESFFTFSSISFVGGFLFALALMCARARPRQMKRRNCEAREQRAQAAVLHANVMRSSAKILEGVLSDIANSHYVVKDKERFRSIYQTPLRDNLNTLRDLSLLLRREASLALNEKLSVIKTPMLGASAYQKHEQAESSAPDCLSAEVCEDILPAIQNYAVKNNMVLNIQEQSHSQICVPKGICERLVRELLLNAIRHNPQGSQIQLSCGMSKDSYSFVVSDNGLGLPSAMCEKIYIASRKGASLRGRRTSDAQTKINLVRLAALVSEYQGKLTIRTALGLGTTIALHFPLAELSHRPFLSKRKRRQEYRFEGVHQRKKLMFIGKQKATQSRLIKTLSSTYAISIYSTLDLALRDIFESRPDIIVTDFSWQNSLCVQLCQFLRSSLDFAATPLLMISTSIDARARVAAYAAGVNAIIEKPLDCEELKVLAASLCKNAKELSSGVAEDSSHYEYAASPQEKRDFKQRFNDIMLEVYQNEGLKISDIATRFHISEKTLQRRLLKHYDMTFAQYLKYYRLREAKALIESGVNVTDAAYDVGFSSSSYFGTCFKDMFGYPPSKLMSNSIVR